MKCTKYCYSIIFLLLLTFCTAKKSDTSLNKEYSSTELTGNWKPVNTEKLPSDIDHKIEFIQLVNDSIAEIQIIDSFGERKILGTWANKFNKKIEKLDLQIESDIRIAYSVDKNHLYTLLLSLSEGNEKLTMTANNYKFHKK